MTSIKQGMRFRFETLESRDLLTALGFVERQEFLLPTSGARDVYAADLDGDGDQDVLSASEIDHKIGWFPNVDGKGTFGPQRVITANAVGASMVRTADLDADGDVDVLSVSPGDGKVAWYENLDGRGTFSTMNVLVTIDQANTVKAEDLDADGDVDVYWSGANVVGWSENLGEASFTHHVLLRLQDLKREALGVTQWNGTDIGDLDDDGDLDLAIAESVFIGASFGAEGQSGWIEQLEDGTWQNHPLYFDTDIRDTTILIADVDDDGYYDIVSAVAELVWFENRFDTEEFWFAHRRPETSALSVHLADLDGDLDPDFIGTNFHGDFLTTSENLDGRGDLGDTVYVSRELNGATSAFAADVDGDGDLDVLTASKGDHSIAWFENVDGLGTLGALNPISRGLNPNRNLVGNDRWLQYDVDQDGDLDWLTANSSGVAWSENLDGRGTLGASQEITDVGKLLYMDLADVDTDGDLDLLLGRLNFTQDQPGLLWLPYENGQFSKDVVTINHGFTENFFLSDLDGDQDLDVVSSSGAMLVWNENLDGKGTFGPKHVIDETRPIFIQAKDVDGDGDPDLIVAPRNDTNIRIYLNLDGQGTFGEGLLVLGGIEAPGSVLAEDMDGDGDLDFVVKSDYQIAYYERLGVDYLFAQPQVFVEDLVSKGNLNSFDAAYIDAEDFDGDGDLDIALRDARYDRLLHYENRLSGDADNDGQVAFADFLALAANFGQAERNWHDGDFDHDGDVDFADFLALSANFGTKRF